VVVAVVSSKGGVGKTMTVANLGPALAGRGLRVLMVDFDPQADLSASWGVDDESSVPRLEDLLEGSPADPVSACVGLPVGERATGSLALLPTSRSLRRLTGRMVRESILADRLSALAGRFDVILVDTPAGESVFSAQAIIAADEVLVPVLPGYHEVRALYRVLDEIDAQVAAEGTRLGLLGVVFVNAEGRWRTMKAYRPHLEDEDIGVFETIIERHQPVTDHARWGRPTFLLRRGSKVARAYDELAGEVVERLAARERERRVGA
jgi:chromosome partitioning protein